MKTTMRISFIGSGNLATSLAVALKKVGHSVEWVFSPTIEHAQELANRVGAKAPSSIANALAECGVPDVVVIAVKDDVIGDVAKQYREGERQMDDAKMAVVIHASGSTSLSVLDGPAGVMWPMQSFSKGKLVDFSDVPLFIEASDDEALAIVKDLAASLSERVKVMPSEQRKRLHLAAVFASNMTNHCYALAAHELEKVGVDFGWYEPLVMETARKAFEMPPVKAQTGPMVRGDKKIMSEHISMIDDKLTQEIYRLFAQSIRKYKSRN